MTTVARGELQDKVAASRVTGWDESVSSSGTRIRDPLRFKSADRSESNDERAPAPFTGGDPGRFASDIFCWIEWS